MGKPKAPAAPDPKVTAAAQTGTNVTTALANAQLANVNKFGPDGSETWTTNGGQNFTDPTSGANYFIPQYEQRTTLSPAQQAIKDATDSASLNLGTIARDQSAFLKDYLNKPFSLDGMGTFKIDNEATEARLMELGRKRLDPLIAQREEATRTRLANSGIKQGSKAWDVEMGNFSQGTNDAYNQLLLTGRQQAGSEMTTERQQRVQEALTQRNQPLNEIGALMSGSQVSMPQFGGTQQPALPTVDYAGLVNENYNQQMQAYQQKNAARQNVLGGLFGLGSAFITSDRRAKKDIKPAGRLMGHKLYSYTYKGDDKPQIGVMAQEVEKTRPDAVREVGGLKQVNYGKLFELGRAVAA